MIDLHTHSTCSDGSDTPSQIIAKAAQLGLKAVALTDHDVVDGLAEFQSAAKAYPDLIALNGVELAVSWPDADVEILALNITHAAPFAERQQLLLQKRNEANFERARLLQKIGFDITMEELSRDQNGQPRKVVGRPHFAELMLKKGYVSSFQEAFRKYMLEGCPAYVPRQNPPLRETVEFIRANGAFASLAHPVHTKMDNDKLAVFLKKIKGYGLSGVECYHSDHSPEQICSYLEMARKIGLYPTGGSDYHGLVHPDTQLGIGKGGLQVPDSILNPILNGARCMPARQMKQER